MPTDLSTGEYIEKLNDEIAALRAQLALQEAESVRLLQYARRAQSLIETVDRVAEQQGDDQFVYFYNLPSGPWHGLLACARDFPGASQRTALLAAVIEATTGRRLATLAAFAGQDNTIEASIDRSDSVIAQIRRENAAIDALRAFDAGQESTFELVFHTFKILRYAVAHFSLVTLLS